jgi:hypothetical protein
MLPVPPCATAPAMSPAGIGIANLGIRAKPLPPKVLERRRAQLRVARRVLDRPVAEPVLNAPRVVVGIGQGVAPGVAQHASVDRKGEAGARADALDVAVDGIGRERAAAPWRRHHACVSERRPSAARCQQQRTPSPH